MFKSKLDLLSFSKSHVLFETLAKGTGIAAIESLWRFQLLSLANTFVDDVQTNQQFSYSSLDPKLLVLCRSEQHQFQDVGGKVKCNILSGSDLHNKIFCPALTSTTKYFVRL